MANVRVVEGVEPDSDAEQLISRWVTEAAVALSFEGELLVYVWGHVLVPPSDGGVASADENSVAFHATLLFEALRDRAGTGKENLRLGFYAYEEVAHFLLSREGVPGDGDGTFFQELFATWVMYQHMVVSGRLPTAWLTTEPVNTDPRWLLYVLGKHLGAALAGSEPNPRHLDNWLAQDGESEEAELVRFAEERLNPPLTAEAVAAAYREWTGRS